MEELKVRSEVGEGWCGQSVNEIYGGKESFNLILGRETRVCEECKTCIHHMTVLALCNTVLL